MKSKLIKLSDTHYIIVDDSEIKEGDWVFNYFNNTIYNIVKSNSNRQILAISSNLILDDIKSFPNQYKKITHSTQSIENHPDLDYPFFHNVDSISLSEVEEAIYGYSVENAAYHFCDNVVHPKDETRSLYFAFCTGFKTHQELVKDKLFTVDDMKKAIHYGVSWNKQLLSGEIRANDYIQSLLPKTECGIEFWDIEFDEQGKIKLIYETN